MNNLASAIPILSGEIIQQARELSMRQDLSMVQSLQQITDVTPEALMAALGNSFNYPVLLMRDLQNLQPDFERISFTEAAQRGAVVATAPGGYRYLVLSDPFDSMAEEWALRRYATASQALQTALVHPADLQAYFTQQERQLRAMDGFENDSRRGNDEEVAAVITLATISDDASPVVKLVNSTLYDALKLQASDIHLECDAGCLHVMYRIDGVLVPITQLQGQEMAEQVISRIKVMAELDIAERRVPQDGRFKVRVNEREIDFRVSIMPNIFGEDAVLRLLDRQSLTEEAKALRLDNLG
ncbi:MAG: hypothetical protein RL020_222, partial [Pseudomonadota bacterium]